MQNLGLKKKREGKEDMNLKVGLLRGGPVEGGEGKDERRG
jgi:hypothetical protein